MAASVSANEGNTVDDFMRESNAIQNACDHRKTLALLRALKAGTVSLDNVTMTGDVWTVAEVDPPAEPMTEVEPDAVEPPEEVA